MSTYQPKPASAFVARPKQWTSRPNRPNRPDPAGSQNAQRNYDRYMELARAMVLAGDTVGAENYYQHAEHYLRSMSPKLT
jgi:hypothetical protein